MIPRSRAVIVVAVTLAVAIHVLALHGSLATETVRVKGSGSVKTAALGSSFNDFVAGTNAAAPASAQQPAVTPNQTQSKVSPTSQVQKTAQSALKPSIPSSSLATVTPNQTQPISALTQVQPTAQTALKASVPDKAAATDTSTAQKAVELHKTEAAKSQEKATPVPPVKNSNKSEQDQQKVNQASLKQGNAKQDKKKGSEAGETNQGEAKANKTKQAAAGQGNAEANNYAGQVKRRITRTRRKRVNIRGSALVSFRIADNGALLQAVISKSSGSSRLDQVALAQVKSASPFPKPPASARRDYTIEILGQ